ncbi:unnamed protein product [Closterium sp. NIES-65]|nr:unnamed protein product [Closterium sp. NIES-65]
MRLRVALSSLPIFRIRVPTMADVIRGLSRPLGAQQQAAALAPARAAPSAAPTRTAQSLSFPTGLALPLLARAALPLASRLSFAAAPAAITPAGCFPRCRSAPHARTGFIRDPSFPAECSRRRTRALLSAFRPRGECRAQAHDSAASMPTPESPAAAPAGEGSAERRDGGAAEAADGAGSAQGEPFLVLNFYHFADVEDAHGDVERHRAFLQERDIRGRIYISHQGINAQQSGLAHLSVSRSPLCRLSQLSVPASHVMDGVRRLSGPASHVMEYAEWVRSDQRFTGVPLQLSPSPIGHAFPRRRLRYKPALVQVGCPASTTLYLFLSTGTAVDLSCGPRLPAPPPALQAGARAGEWSWLHHTVPSVVQVSGRGCTTLYPPLCRYGATPRKYGATPRKYAATPRKYGATPRKYGATPRAPSQRYGATVGRPVCREARVSRSPHILLSPPPVLPHPPPCPTISCLRTCGRRHGAALGGPLCRHAPVARSPTHSPPPPRASPLPPMTFPHQVAGGMEQLSADLCAATPLSPAEWRSKIDQMQRGEGEGGGEADRERRQGEDNKGRGEEAVARTKKIMLLDVRNGGCFVFRHAGCAVRNGGCLLVGTLLYLLSQATMASTPTATTSRTPPSESRGSSAGGTSSSTSLVCMDSKHAVYRHFKVPANSVGENGTKVCAYCNFTFVGGVHRCAQHITSWNGMRRREVHLCTAAPKTARDAVKALYESKLKAREAKRVAEIAAVGAVNGRGSDKKKSRMTDFYGDDAACANQVADEAISLFFAALHVPEHHADHPLWRNVVSSIQRAGPNYVAPKRRYIGGAGLAKCRQRIEAALAPISASWRRDGVTVASDMFSDKAGRPQANVLLINDSGAVFVESIDTKMEMKTGGYIACILRPIIEKVGPENVVALCFDGGSNYAAACRVLMREYPHIEHIPCATHVLDLLMEDIGKKGWAKDIVTHGDTLISFVRNHHFTRGYVRSPLVNGGKGKQVLKPAGTRFGTNYIAINRLCEVRASLTQMVLSDEWVEWTAAADRAGADTFKDNILDAAWWTRAEFFAKLMRLPFVVMRKTDSDSKGMMGRLYDLMLQLTEDIRDFLDEHAEGVLTSDEVGDIREIVQDRWDNGLACNLHVIGRILYPTNQEECIFRTDLECTRVFKQYVSKHHGDKTVTRKDGVERRASLVIQEGLNAFLNLQGSFGMLDAIADRQAVKEGKMTAATSGTWAILPGLCALLSRLKSYEWDVGHFAGAVRPPVDNFRSTEFGLQEEHTEATTAEQQQQLQQQQQQEEEEAGRQEEGAYDPLSEADKEETEVLMYCTGGIRCDVYSALLRQQGFKRLYTLEGGVARYMREQGGDHWNGRLFVFDSRLAVPPRDYQVGGKVLRAAEEEGVERVGEVLGEVLGGMMGAVEGEEEESVGCQRCGGRLEEVKHRNCANSDCNALILFCSTCAQAMNGACSTECAAAPRLRPFLARPEPYQRLHTYLPTAPPPRLPGYVSRRALKRRARKARRLAAAEGGEGQGAGEGREEGQEMGRGQEVEVAA